MAHSPGKLEMLVEEGGCALPGIVCRLLVEAISVGVVEEGMGRAGISPGLVLNSRTPDPFFDGWE